MSGPGFVVEMMMQASVSVLSILSWSNICSLAWPGTRRIPAVAAALVRTQVELENLRRDGSGERTSIPPRPGWVRAKAT
ncbi:hypothetical protein L227DRAFT_395250 [Lentinus tigrinus ALCF2SS1-6]|uniref:Uncharacterized protein n=1 Tax=Lentinus tigrinus ALCF2SS1-6 TaxID=1328759 RepID=A0A5C2RRN9_9APHY|nr:hypothetical protein L227DRAFT_395250 [Lentinus tigrinus ALCF2SS1-6]